MSRCIVKECVYNKTKVCRRDKRNFNIHLFTFPMDNERRESWRLALNLNSEDIFKYSRVCHLHFNNDAFDYEKSPFSLSLKKNAIPSERVALADLQCSVPDIRPSISTCYYEEPNRELPSTVQKKPPNSPTIKTDSVMDKEVKLEIKEDIGEYKLRYLKNQLSTSIDFENCKNEPEEANYSVMEDKVKCKEEFEEHEPRCMESQLATPINLKDFKDEPEEANYSVMADEVKEEFEEHEHRCMENQLSTSRDPEDCKNKAEEINYSVMEGKVNIKEEFEKNEQRCMENQLPTSINLKNFKNEPEEANYSVTEGKFEVKDEFEETEHKYMENPLSTSIDIEDCKNELEERNYSAQTYGMGMSSSTVKEDIAIGEKTKDHHNTKEAPGPSSLGEEENCQTIQITSSEVVCCICQKESSDAHTCIICN
ncbi:uncharacterized protein LOC126890438 isoform X8 [Diabrotica virgifera virgifera]|uniref:THAP-type domain-containing protein n=1 Tax=Diabrotica virgifera virgifera TaxID=50390 RepID=A0ABM5KYS6_DIAVI|nr:uncharacterized protein LOC126890438 isoform X8 [Diabrotica virgifera virgifera]